MMDTVKKERMVEQDIAKGFAIIFVVMLHTLTLKKEVFLILGGLVGFILPFFFFMAGYNYRPGRYSPLENIKRRIRYMMVPYLIYATVIVAVAGAYLYFTEGYSIEKTGRVYLKSILSGPTVKLLGITVEHDEMSSCIMVSWFILMLFAASIIFFLLVEWCLGRMERLISVCTGLCLVSMVFAHFNIMLPFHLSEAPAIAAIMIIGAAFGEKRLLSPDIGRKKILLNSIVSYVIFLTLAALFRGSGFIMGGMLWSSPLYEWNIPLVIVFAIMGSYSFVHFCRIFSRLKIISAAMSWCGNHTVELLLLHNIVQLFVCRILGMQPFRLSVMSEVNDFATFGVLALEIIGTVAIILLIEKIASMTKKKSQA